MVTTSLLVIIYVTFISLGLPDAVLGSAWPTMMHEFAAPVWGAGLLQMTVSLCTIISSLNCARMIRALGTGRLTAISVALTAAALFGYSVAPGYAALLLLAIPLGLGAGAVDAAINNYVALHCEARHMNWLHCFWGLGTIVGPMILSACLHAGMTWSIGYRAVSFLQIALCIVLFMTLNLWKQGGMPEAERSARVLSAKEVLALPGARFGLPMFLCYCGVEQMMLIWVPTFMVLVRGISDVQAALYGSVFCMGLTLGRLISGFLAIRLLPKTLVRLGAALMLAGFALMLIPVNAVIVAGVVLVGLGCAPVYPNVVQDTPVNYGAENSQAVIGVQMAFAYIGSMFMPTVFAYIASFTGFGILPVFGLLITGVMAVLFGKMKRIVENRTQAGE